METSQHRTANIGTESTLSADNDNNDRLSVSEDTNVLEENIAGSKKDNSTIDTIKPSDKV